MIDKYTLRIRQSLSLEDKINLTKLKIKTFYRYNKGAVYVSFSGGLDSTVLLNLVREVYPDILGVFINTGLEHVDNVEFIQEQKNIKIIQPKKSYKEIIEKHGYPVVSKMVSMAISRYRNTKDPIQKRLRLYGGLNPNTNKFQKMGVIPKKWRYLINAPFKISEKCCDILKKRPALNFEKQTGLSPYIGTMAEDSFNRQLQYLKNGCNGFNKKHVTSAPLGFWRRQDILKYFFENNISYSKAYGRIYKNDNRYYTDGENIRVACFVYLVYNVRRGLIGYNV